MLASLEASGADFDASAFCKLDPLEIQLPASFADRIKLGGANTVGVPSA